MAYQLTERVEGRVEAALKEWLQELALRTERSEGAIIRLALRDYRAKVTRRKAG